MRRRFADRVIAVGVVAVAVASGACRPAHKLPTKVDISPDRILGAVTTTTFAVPTDPAAAAAAFFTAMATFDPPRMQPMRAVANPGSPADTYAQFQLALATANLQAGRRSQASRVDTTGGTVRLCPQAGGTCNTFADFAADPDTHRLTDFTVNGRTIADRLVRGGQGVTAAGVTFRLLAAYEAVAPSDILLVGLEIGAGPEPVRIDLASSVYVGPAGQVPASDAAGTPDIRTSATATVVLSFPGAKPGGQVHLRGAPPGGPVLEATVAVPAAS